VESVGLLAQEIGMPRPTTTASPSSATLERSVPSMRPCESVSSVPLILATGLRHRSHGLIDEQIAPKVAEEGDAVVVGPRHALFPARAARRLSTSSSTLRAPKKVRRLLQDECTKIASRGSRRHVDRERIAFVKHYFDADWPTRSLYHVMINTACRERSGHRDDSQHNASSRRPSQSHRL